MELTIRQINMLCDSLVKIKDINLPVSIAYSIVTLFKQIAIEREKFEEIRNNKVKEYGQEFEGKIKVTEENMASFSKEMEELLDKKIDFKDLELIDKKYLFSHDFNISASDLFNIEPVFKV